MSSVNYGFFTEMSSFIQNHKVMCGLTLGVAAVIYALGNLAGRAISWIREGCGTAKKTEAVAHETFKNIPSQSGKDEIVPEQEERIGEEMDFLFWHELSQNTREQLQGLEFLPATMVKQRFSNILCPAATAVSVGDQHLHANRVGGAPISQRTFVASQAPLKEEQETFWKAVYESDSTIFDLTTKSDQDNGVEPYYPTELNKLIVFGAIRVMLVSENEHTYRYQVENLERAGMKFIERCHCANWIDHGALLLPSLHDLVLKASSHKALWIHCRAGVGRTGTLISVMILKEKIASGQIGSKNLGKSVIGILVELRKQRGPNFVQTEAQFNLLMSYARFLLQRM